MNMYGGENERNQVLLMLISSYHKNLLYNEAHVVLVNDSTDYVIYTQFCINPLCYMTLEPNQSSFQQRQKAVLLLMMLYI